MGLFGLRPVELKAMRVKDGKLKIGNFKRNRATAKAPKPDRVAYPLEIPELAGASGQALAQLKRAGEAAGWDPQGPRLQNLWAHLQAIPRSPSLWGCSGQSQSWTFPEQPSAWRRLPRSPCRHTSQTGRRINGPRRAHPHEALRPMD